MRSNNPRDAIGERARTPSGSPRPEGSSSTASGELETPGPSRESVKKLDQIIQVNCRPSLVTTTLADELQNFFLKAGSIVATSRVDGTKIKDSKPNKWVCRLF